MKKIVRISEKHKDVTCENCGWSWDIEPDDKHPYLCHQCGHENTKGETDEGAGAYDAPSFQMEPDHVHFKHQYNEQNVKSKYLLQMGRKSIILEQYGDEVELFKLASSYYKKNGKEMTVKVLEKILHTLSKRDEPHRAKSDEFPPSFNLQEEKVDIESQYQGSIDKKFYNFLKSNIEVEGRSVDFSDKPFVLMYVNGKSRLLSNSKKYLVNVLLNAYGDDFPNLNDASKRLTAKKYIDELKKQYFYED
jgi:hypothetical protein